MPLNNANNLPSVTFMYIPVSGSINQLALLLGVALLAQTAFATPSIVGKVSFVRGSNAAQQPGGAPRILGQDTDVFQGDNIQTTERSFVIITFNDGTKVTVRPNSNFSVDEFNGQRAQLTLHEGILRADHSASVTKNTEDFQIKTPLGSVQAQNADYSVRFCQTDCGPQNKAVPTSATQENQAAVARVVDIKGTVIAKKRSDSNAKDRQLSVGAPLYSTDNLHSGADSYALMVFRDGEKITLQANSDMDITDYSYQKPGQSDHALYRLTVGGMRALTGSIGKTNKSAYAIDTPVGTIGIRGTGFDLTCIGSCVGKQSSSADSIQDGSAEGLYSHVWQGQIVLKNDSGEHVLTMPESGYVANRRTDIFQLPDIPVVIPNNLVPRPDKHIGPVDKLFGRQQPKTLPSGLYVVVHKGQAQLRQETPAARNNPVNVNANEVAHVDQRKVVTRQTNPQSLPNAKQEILLSGTGGGQAFQLSADTVLSDDGGAVPGVDDCSN